MMYLCPMYSKELIKGILPTIILKLLSEKGKMYGYQITQEVKDISNEKILIKEGSLYPALHKLKENGLVLSETVNIGKRVRLYYSLTEAGIEFKNEKIEELNNFILTINKIIK